MTTINKTPISKRLLPIHQSVGTALAAVLYLICITGAIVVFYPEFERLEQANIPEFEHFTGESAELVFDNYQVAEKKPAESVYIVLPTFDQPRAHLSAGGEEWWLSEGGEKLDSVSSPWTEMLKDLHLYLHLPKQFGMIVVSIFGVMLLHLVISGVLAHRRIYKDLFRYRKGGTGQQANIDLHNRFSVLGLPFHIMIAITGAFFGMFSIFSAITANVTHQGDETQLIEDIYGGDPIVTSSAKRDVVAGFEHLYKMNPEAKPIYIVVQNMGKANEFYEIAATLPGRLIYSEIYRYQSDGTYIAQQGFENGSAGRQVIYSIYRLHFGHFDSYWIKTSYFILGIGLALICVSGINIWLNRRGYESKLNYFWHSFVWASPISIVLTACMAITGVEDLTLSFWTIALFIVVVGGFFSRISVLKSVMVYSFIASASLLIFTLNYKYAWLNEINIITAFNYAAVVLLVIVAITNTKKLMLRKHVSIETID